MICSPKKKGFTFIEIMIVVTIIGIMTSVVLVYVSGDKSSRAVEVAARQVAAAIREAQNNALSGKQIDTVNIACGHGFYFDSGVNNNKYKLFYNYDTVSLPGSQDCSNPVTPVSTTYDANSADYTTYSLNNKVEFSSGTSEIIYFTMPHGDVYENGSSLTPSAKILLVSPDGNDKYTVCVYTSGRVEEKKGDVSC